ncbi:MAG: protein kinase [Pseudanabaena sp. ELA607]
MATNLAPGQTIGGHFKLLKRLGSGGFGETFLSQDVHLPDCPYRVVKRLQPRNPDPEMHSLALRLFDNEAQMLYRLGSHDRIPQLFAHFPEGDDFFLVQEYIEGVDLSKEILRSQKLPPAQVATVYTQVKKLCTQVVKPLQYKVFIDIYLFSIVQGLLRMPNEKSRFQEPKISQFSVKPNWVDLCVHGRPKW